MIAPGANVRVYLACGVTDSLASPARAAIGRSGPRCRRCPSNEASRDRGLVAHVLIAKYCGHLPLYRQSEIYAREGVDLSRSTMADWIGKASTLLEPLLVKLRDHVFAGHRLHGDDTPVPVLEPGKGKTRTGRLWTYVRDGRPYGDTIPPAVCYFFSPDRRRLHPKRHLATFSGVLHADGYAGFRDLYEPHKPGGPPAILEAACWAHLWTPPTLQG